MPDAPTVPQQNFQPQVGDTTNGPTNHTYVPRSDGNPAITLANGQTYVPLGYGTGLGGYPMYPGYGAYNPPTGPGGVVNGPSPILYQQPQHGYYAPMYPQYIMQQPPQAYMPGYGHIQQPAFGTIGHTPYEILNQQLALAQKEEVNKKQEMKPGDDDKHRMYWVRELDGSWTQRNRVTIDSGDIGDVRWYAIDGSFYAVRLPES